jgi:hypothetical protein
MNDTFWDKVDVKSNDECWEWKLANNKYGYGSVSINNKTYRAHRIAYELYHNRPIQEGMIILHSCDNRRCCNPNHLSEGTNKDNSKDMINKGRSLTGERNPDAKLTYQQVEDIRLKYSIGNISWNKLANEYNVSKRTIGRIINKKTWNH